MRTSLLAALILLAGQTAEPTLEQLRTAAQERMREDRARYSAGEMREIETLYQSANRDLKAPGAAEALKQLVAKYPQSNRAGCALLYVARMFAQGEERETLLEQIIANHSDARYGDGTQVGAFARAMLADIMRRSDRLDQAKALAAEVVAKYPGAVDHNGRRIAGALKQMGLI